MYVKLIFCRCHQLHDSVGCVRTLHMDLLLEQVMEVHPLAVRDVSVQCAMEDSCLVFFDDTSMADALAAFDDTGKTVGMVQVRLQIASCSTCAGHTAYKDAELNCFPCAA